MTMEDEEDKPVDASLDANDDEGGDGSGSGEDAEESGGGLNAKKIILFVVLPLFILAGVGGGLFFTGTLDKMLGKGGEEQHAEADSHDDGHGDKKKKKKKGKDDHGDGHGDDSGGKYGSVHFLKIPNMSVTLNSTGSQPRYLSLDVQLELSSASDKEAVEAVMPRIIDQFQTYLRELRVKDLRGSQGIYRLQMELLSRVNAAAYPIEVEDVLFEQILIQ